jgi:hypothetical protein
MRVEVPWFCCGPQAGGFWLWRCKRFPRARLAHPKQKSVSVTDYRYDKKPARLGCQEDFPRGLNCAKQYPFRLPSYQSMGRLKAEILVFL